MNPSTPTNDGRSRVALLSLLAALLLAAAQGFAQDYPKGPINLVIPLAPGDAPGLDAVSRQRLGGDHHPRSASRARDLAR